MRVFNGVSPALFIFILVAGLILPSANANDNLLASGVNVEPFPDELSALKKVEANPSKVNIESLADIRYRHAIRLMQLSEKKKAKNHLELAVMYVESATMLSPNNAKYWTMLGMLYEGLKDNPLAPIMAVEALKKAILLNPMDSSSRLLLGYLYFSQERYSLALEQYEHVLSNSTNVINPSIIASMSIAYIIDFQNDRGISFFKKILDKNPDADTARLAMAILLRQKKKNNDAEGELQKILRSPKATASNRQYAAKLIQEWKKEVAE